jgi:hypothetical protein
MFDINNGRSSGCLVLRWLRYGLRIVFLLCSRNKKPLDVTPGVILTAEVREKFTRLLLQSHQFQALPQARRRSTQTE